MPENLPAALRFAELSTDPSLSSLIARANDPERKALLDALAAAHHAGQREAEQRTGRIIAQVLAPLLGVRQPDGESTPQAVGRIVSVLRRFTA